MNIKTICRKLLIGVIAAMILIMSWGIVVTVIFLSASSVMFFIKYLDIMIYLSGLPFLILFLAVAFGSLGLGLAIMGLFVKQIIESMGLRKELTKKK